MSSKDKAPKTWKFRHLPLYAKGARVNHCVVALHDLSQFSAQDICHRRSEEVNLIYAFLHYMLLSPVVPRYVNDKFCSIVRRLLKSPGFHPLFHVSESTRSAVRKVLKKWLKVVHITDQDGLRREAEENSKNFWSIERDHLYWRYRISDEELSNHQADVDWYINTSNLRSAAADEARQLDQSALKKRLTLNACLANALNLSDLVHPADLLFSVVHEVLPPPVSLLSLHSSEMRRYYCMAHNEVELTTSDDNNIFFGVANQVLKLSQGDTYDLSAVFDGFVPNMTGVEYLDRSQQIQSGKDHQLADTWSFLQFLSILYSGNTINTSPRRKYTFFELSCLIWEKAALAVKQLSLEPESSLCFEFTSGDMNTIARRIALSAEERAAQNLPSRFLRAFVSNVQDYTGLLYPLLDIAPLLEQSTKAFLRCNVQRNIDFWTNCRRWAESQLVFEDADYAGAVFGVCILLGSQHWHFVWWGKDRTLIQQPSKLDEGTVCTLLHRVFIGVAFPPSQRLDCSVFHHPESLVVFVELLLILIERGFDRRWIRDAVEAMLALQANIFNPRPPQLEEHLPEKRTAPFRPFLLELRTLLALYQPILNLGIAPEFDVPRHESISLRSVTWTSDKIAVLPIWPWGTDEERSERRWRALFMYTGMIIFPDQYLGKRPRELALLKGTQTPAHFLSAVSWCLSTRTACFYLPDQDYERMKSEAMNVVMYSTVTYDTITEPIKLQ